MCTLHMLIVLEEIGGENGRGSRFERVLGKYLSFFNLNPEMLYEKLVNDV